MVKSNIETYLRIKPSRNNLDTQSYFQNQSSNDETNTQELIYDIKNSNFMELKIPDEMRKGYVNNLKRTYEFKFTGIFDKTTPQEEIFNNIGQKVIKNSLQGYNNTVFCYGQTGSGKTFTMCGSKVWKERGLIPRILVELFKQIRKSKSYSYEIFISYLEIYNENAYDLLDRHHSEIEIESWRKIIVYEDNSGNIMLKNLSMIKVENEQQALDLLMTGNFIRHVSSTPMNQASSRSHAIFSCMIEGRELNSEVMRVSKINLVDLAGSERMKSTMYDSSTVNETKYINLSLSFLEQVIIALNDKSHGPRTHIPYRNSLMTTILKDSLGGNCKTILVANVSSEIDSLEETISTMRFAVRCAKVENEITVNEHMDLNILVSKLHSENEELRKKLSFFKNKNFLDILPNYLSPYEKDECKILISEYLNDNSKEKKLNAKNANQLFFIIDFLIEYISNKERVFKEKMTDTLQENKELNQINLENELKVKKYLEIIDTNPGVKESLAKKKRSDPFGQSKQSIQSEKEYKNVDGLSNSQISDNQININTPNLYVKTLPKKRLSEGGSASFGNVISKNK